jgi:hypothetical protein
MTTKTDLEIILDVVSRAAIGTVKHHEVSLALQALERLSPNGAGPFYPVTREQIAAALSAGIQRRRDCGSTHDDSEPAPLITGSRR